MGVREGDELTYRELGIAAGIASGLSYRAIGYASGIVSQTVKNHVVNMKIKRGLEGRATTVLILGLVRDGSLALLRPLGGTDIYFPVLKSNGQSPNSRQ